MQSEVKIGWSDGYLLQQASIDKYSTFSLWTNHYSVPDYLVGQKIDVKIMPIG